MPMSPVPSISGHLVVIIICLLNEWDMHWPWVILYPWKAQHSWGLGAQFHKKLTSSSAKQQNALDKISSATGLVQGRVGRRPVARAVRKKVGADCAGPCMPS